MMLLTVNACVRTASKSGQSDFNASSTKLANVPAGYEMGETVFSSDGRHVAITAIRDDKAVVFYDSKMSKEYEAVRDLVLRPGSSDYVFVGRKDGKECVFANGVEDPMYDRVGQPFFAPDGRIIYEARRNEQWVIVSGKRESAPFYSDKPAPFVSSDGKRLAYIEHHGDTKQSNLRACSIDLKDCVSGEDYDSLEMLKTASSGSHVAYIAGKDGKKAIVTMDFSQPGLIEKEGHWYDDITIFNFSNKGDHLAYLARTENRSFIGKDGVEFPTEKYDTVFEMSVSYSGRPLYSAMVKGNVVAFIDGRQTGKEYHGIYTPRFSADGSNYVFAADKGDKSVVIINGQETQAFDKVVTPKFNQMR
jgi:hypothetical protein